MLKIAVEAFVSQPVTPDSLPIYSERKSPLFPHCIIHDKPKFSNNHGMLPCTLGPELAALGQCPTTWIHTGGCCFKLKAGSRGGRAASFSIGLYTSWPQKRLTLDGRKRPIVGLLSKQRRGWVGRKQKGAQQPYSFLLLLLFFLPLNINDHFRDWVELSQLANYATVCNVHLLKVKAAATHSVTSHSPTTHT